MATADAFLREAASEIGYREDPSGSNRTKFAKEAGHPNGAPWCASFVVAIARRVGVNLPSESAYTPTMAAGFKKENRWHAKDPKPGDLVFFDFPDSQHRIQHVGIVAEVRADGSLTTVEGNTASGDHGSQHNGGGVYRRHRTTRYVVGYGRPRFEPTPPLFAQEDMLLMAIALNDKDARRAWARRQCLDFWGREPAVDHLDYYTNEIGKRGADSVLAEIADHSYAMAFRAKRGW